MSDRCPHCGQLMPHVFVVDLDSNEARRGGRTAVLSRQTAILAHILLEARGQYVTRFRMECDLWGDTELWPSQPESALTQLLAKLRRRVAPLGVEVDTVRLRGSRLIVNQLSEGD